MFPATTPKTCAHILTREEARDALSRALRVCRESGIRKLGIPKRIYENRELVRCLYEQHMALGQAFTTFIGVAESSRRFFDAIVDALKETFPDVGQFPERGNKSGAPLPEETKFIMKCLDGLIAVCGTSGEKLAKLQTENREIVYLLKNNPAFSERLGFIESWLEDHELFFEDLRHALKDIFKKVSGDAALPTYGWMGNDLTEFQLQFNTDKMPVQAEGGFLDYIHRMIQRIHHANTATPSETPFFKHSNIFASEKKKRMIKILQTYLSGFKIETFSPVSMALWVGAMALSLYTPHEGNLYVALLHIKVVLVCPLLGMFLVKILLLRELSILFDIVTLIILIMLSAQII
ncbi:hypothetical protein [Bilophila sp.]|uniref:hypothetical protein n=1 Tax=Bilophila sp. TaxID=1929485 RepID=UPI00307754C7